MKRGGSLNNSEDNHKKMSSKKSVVGISRLQQTYKIVPSYNVQRHLRTMRTAEKPYLLRGHIITRTAYIFEMSAELYVVMSRDVKELYRIFRPCISTVFRPRTLFC